MCKPIEAMKCVDFEPYEVNPDGGYVAFGVCVVSKSKEQARFSYTGVTDEEELEEVIVSEQKKLLAVQRTLASHTWDKFFLKRAADDHDVLERRL